MSFIKDKAAMATFQQTTSASEETAKKYLLRAKGNLEVRARRVRQQRACRRQSTRCVHARLSQLALSLFFDDNQLSEHLNSP